MFLLKIGGNCTIQWSNLFQKRDFGRCPHIIQKQGSQTSTGFCVSGPVQEQNQPIWTYIKMDQTNCVNSSPIRESLHKKILHPHPRKLRCPLNRDYLQKDISSIFQFFSSRLGDFSSHFWRRSQESFEAEYLAIAAYRLFASERPRIAPSFSRRGMKTSVG